MIAAILPPGVVAEYALDDPPGPPLYAEEEAVIRRAVDKRRREFGTVRRCARTALARLGVPPAPLLPDRRGAIRWPSGVLGSMTHCAGYRAAAVASTSMFAAIGIDAEPHEALPDGVFAQIARPAERAWIARHAHTGARPVVHWDRLLFSTKESVFKAWYPATRRELGFDQAEVSFDEHGGFEARLLVPGPVAGYRGRWLARDGLVLTAIAVPAAEA